MEAHAKLMFSIRFKKYKSVAIMKLDSMFKQHIEYLKKRVF